MAAPGSSARDARDFTRREDAVGRRVISVRTRSVQRRAATLEFLERRDRLGLPAPRIDPVRAGAFRCHPACQPERPEHRHLARDLQCFSASRTSHPPEGRRRQPAAWSVRPTVLPIPLHQACGAAEQGAPSFVRVSRCLVDFDKDPQHERIHGVGSVQHRRCRLCGDVHAIVA